LKSGKSGAWPRVTRGAAGLRRRAAARERAILAPTRRSRPSIILLWVAVFAAGSFATTPHSPAAPLLPALEEPITPIPQPVIVEAAKVDLGEQLFRDRRLSHDSQRSCESCHDLESNGASGAVVSTLPNGNDGAFNTLTVFNAALNFRYNWAGGFRTLEAQAAASIENPRVMATSIDDVVARLKADPETVRMFAAVYDQEPNHENLLNAIAAFERSLLTPDSRFDRWLGGDTSALSAQEFEGYRLFKALGCVSCHQGVNIGGNLFARNGVFRRLASPEPEMLRVPSLRNVGVTAPYFHDGSAPTLEHAIRRMGSAQLNSTLTDQQIAAIASYLRTLTGNFRGHPVRVPD
jgi:cytochrome c peroxidase